MEKPSKKELLPCPFCGGEAEIIDIDKILKLKLRYSVGCSEEFCGARIGGLFKTTNEAIALWNTRVPRKIVYPEKRVKEKGLGINTDWAWKDGFNWSIDEFRRLNGEER